MVQNDDALCFCGKLATRQAGKRPVCQRHYKILIKDRMAVLESIEQFISDLLSIPRHGWATVFICVLRQLEKQAGNINWLLPEIEAEIVQRDQFGAWYADADPGL